MWESACWPQLKQLYSIRMPGEGAAALARGLPSLEVLDAVPEGQWADAGPAVFGRVRQARLADCCESFNAHARTSSLLPSLERLTLWEERDTIATDLAGSTGLTHLVLGWNDGENFSALHPRAWTVLPTLSRLRHLALDAMPAELPQLAHLPAALEVLCVNVAHGLDDEGEVEWAPEDMDGAPDLCGALEPAARLPRLRTLYICAPGMAVHHGTLAQLVRARLCALEELGVVCFKMRLHDVSLLAVLPGLRRLNVWQLDAIPDEFSRLAVQHAGTGLQVQDEWPGGGVFSNDFALEEERA